MKESKRSYYEKLKPSSISDNKKFWKTVKPFFSDKVVLSKKITLVENNTLVSDSDTVAKIFKIFFSNAVKNLNIEKYEHFSFDKYFLSKEEENENPILRAIEKYENHPSIIKIKEICHTNFLSRFNLPVLMQ